MAVYKPYKKTSSGKEEIKIPYSSIDGTPTIPDVSGKLSKTENTGVNVLGTTKSTTTLGGNQLVAPNGIIFAGTAANAGLVTRGICGVTTPDSKGACSKENLYINYDGNNDFNAGRQVVLNAGAVGNHLGSNMYQYAVPRGDIVKAWVEAQGYAKTTQMPTVNNGTLTIQKNGETVGTFTANQKDGTTANITVPTEASDIDALPISGGTVTGNLTVGGNLTINGTTTTVDSTTLQVKDKLIEVAHGNTAALTTPAGLVAPKYDGTNSGALVFDSTGTAYVGDVTLKDGNIDVANSGGLQPIATRTGLVGGNLVQYDSSAQTLKDSGKKIGDLATTSQVNAKYTKPSGGIPKTDLASDVQTSLGKADNAMPKSGGTFTGEIKFGSTENFQGYYIKRMIGSLGAGTAYNNLDSLYKDGTWYRMWRLRFPSGSSFWGKIKVTLYGGYSSFNASGVMSKSITCNFNTSNIYNNVGCYDGLGVNVEQDFRISEAIWNDTVSAWEVLIWQKNLRGNNSPVIMLECWTANNTNYINAFNGIAAQPVELTQSTSYSAQKASQTGGTKTVEWTTLPVYENPLGEEIATAAMLPAAANNGKLTIQKNGTDVATFTANQSTNVTANITVPTKASDVNALSLDGGTIKNSKTIKMDASANSDGANLKWGTVNSKNPYIGYASDQVDGTFVVSSLLGTNYASGLAIGGGSGNLLWKGTKVATINDFPNVPKFSFENGVLTITTK